MRSDVKKLILSTGVALSCFGLSVGAQGDGPVDPSKLRDDPRWAWYIDANEKGVLPAFPREGKSGVFKFEDFDLEFFQLFSGPIVDQPLKSRALGWYCVADPAGFARDAAKISAGDEAVVADIVAKFSAARERILAKRGAVFEDVVDPVEHEHRGVKFKNFALTFNRTGWVYKSDFVQKQKSPLNRVYASGSFGLDLKQHGFEEQKVQWAWWATLGEPEVNRKARESVRHGPPIRRLAANEALWESCVKVRYEDWPIKPVSVEILIGQLGGINIDLPGKSLDTFKALPLDTKVYFSVEMELSTSGLGDAKDRRTPNEYRKNPKEYGPGYDEYLPLARYDTVIKRVSVFLDPQMKKAIADYTFHPTFVSVEGFDEGIASSLMPINYPND